MLLSAITARSIMYTILKTDNYIKWITLTFKKQIVLGVPALMRIF